LDLGLLVDAQHHGALWRRQIQPDDIAHLVDEQPVLGQLPGSRCGGAAAEGRQIREPAVCVNPTCAAIDHFDQCVASLGVVSSVRTITSSTFGVADRPRTSRARLINQRVEPANGKARAPLGHHRTPHPALGSDPHVRLACGRSEDDPLCAARRVSGPDDPVRCLDPR